MIDVAKVIPCFVFLPWMESGFMSTMLSLCVFVTIIDAITSILLIIGAVQKRRDFVLVWLVFYLAEIIATVAVLNIAYPVLILFGKFTKRLKQKKFLVLFFQYRFSMRGRAFSFSTSL